MNKLTHYAKLAKLELPNETECWKKESPQVASLYDQDDAAVILIAEPDVISKHTDI